VCDAILYYEEAKRAALEVLRHNLRGPDHALPRAAGWGYPEPYTRDLMFSALGFFATRDAELIDALRRVLETLAHNQSPHGHIPGLAHNPEDRGSSDTTPLFLIALALFRQVTGEPGWLDDAAQKALLWMQYQSPDDRGMVAQQPTTDWRDEQWVLGYGLYVNTLVYIALRLFGRHDWANRLRSRINRPIIRSGRKPSHVLEGLAVLGKPYYALWSFKVHSSDRFDLLGNSLAILSGVASPSKSRRMIAWIEAECARLSAAGNLSGNLPPCFFPYIQRGDPDWHPRDELFNHPGEYHNGGIWPFIGGLYVAALVAAGRYTLAERKLMALTESIRPAREAPVEFGFNEWLRAQDNVPAGQDWQTWSAALYLYAAACVEQRQTPFFETLRML
jgi:hypothetical protein